VSLELLTALVALTYGSRAVALAVLPPMPAWLSAILDRMPPALFAGLAAQALVDPTEGPAAMPVLAAAAGALALAPLRSLPVCLLGGIAAYALAVALI
jgi:branched-subunit amino acid transport protein